MISIQRQLTWKLLFAVVASVGAGLIAITFTARHELLESFDANLRTRALAVTALTEAKNGKVHFEFSPDFLKGFDGAQSHHFFEVWSVEGAPLARSPSLGGADLPHLMPATDHSTFRNLDFPGDHPARMIVLPFQVKTAAGRVSSPPLWAIVASDRSELDRTLNGLLTGAVACAALLYVAVIWWVPRVLRSGLAPLADLAARAAAIDARSLGIRFPSEGLPAELGPIALRLNELLARLEQSFDRERRFSADLAHELRTPLAELRSLTECAMKWPEERSAEWERDMLAATAQTEALATRMLALARSEHGQMLAQAERIDPASLAAQAWKPFEARAAARAIRLKFDLAGSTTLADRVLLQSVLSNLFDNAVEYSPAGSELRISCANIGEACEFRISNPAGELTAQDLPRLFDRFWRKETARGGGGEHVGLGLSLAQSFAASMGWTLRANLDPEGWIVFRLAGPGT
jgi:signal transduction histidine kinase